MDSYVGYSGMPFLICHMHEYLYVISDIEKGGELLKTLVQPDDERIEFKTFSSIVRTYFKSKQMQ